MRGSYRSLGWLCIAVALLTACSSQAFVLEPGDTPTPTPTPSDALRRDAQEYAKRFGVSEQEALKRAQYQDQIGELGNALETNEADTFGGLWIEHEPAYRIVVRFTRDGEETIRPYLREYAFAHLVEVREARYTLAELEAIQAQALRELEKLDFDVSCMLVVQDNRVEVQVSERLWFEGELRRAGVQLPEGVELVVVEGGQTAKDKDLLLTPPVPGIAFPRQKPVEGFRKSMLAELIGALRLDPTGSCLRVRSVDERQDVLPIWPPEYTLQVEGDRVLVIDGEGEVAARTGEEVYIVGGYVPVTDEWVLQQIPQTCRGTYFVVGHEVRPNLQHDSDLLYLDVISTTARTVLFLRHKSALDAQAEGAEPIAGKLVLYDTERCLRLRTEWGPGPVTLLWPLDWSVRLEEDQVVIVDGRGRDVARVGDELLLRGRRVPHTWESEVYRRLVGEMPGDCCCGSWLVDGIERVE